MAHQPTFDPEAPLPGPPDPWAATDIPSTRSGPPYHMTDMIHAEPAVARRIVERLAAADGPAAALAGGIRDAARAGHPVIFTGCGTSEHAAIAAAAITRDAYRVTGLPTAAVASHQAFEVSLDPPPAGLVIGISHEGGTAATNAALDAARTAGARTGLVTVSDRSPGAAIANIVVTTGELDQGWCHVVGYLSPIAAIASVHGHLAGRPIDADAAARLIAAGIGQGDAAAVTANRFADAKRLLVVASGSDEAAGRELVLKVEEGSWLPSAFRHLETFLHGHLPATDAGTALVVIVTDRERQADRAVRARAVLRAAAVVGLRSAAIISTDLDAAIPTALTPAGRLLVPGAPDLPAPVAALLGSATPLQLLAERLARARGTNPDLMRRDDPRYLSAAEAADAVDEG